MGKTKWMQNLLAQGPMGQAVGTTIVGAGSGIAGGAAGGGAGAFLEGRSLWEIAKAATAGGLEGAIGGAFGGATGHLGQGRSTLTRMTLELFGHNFQSFKFNNIEMQYS